MYINFGFEYFWFVSVSIAQIKKHLREFERLAKLIEAGAEPEKKRVRLRRLKVWILLFSDIFPLDLWPIPESNG